MLNRQFFLIKRLFCLPVVIWLLHLSFAFSQGANIKFRHLSLKDGLSQSSINCIFQDSKGFMWFGTQDGLNRYDGYEFTVYKNIPEDTSSLTNSFIHALCQLGSELWIGTDRGINVLHFATKDFTRYTQGNSALNDNVINKFFLDNDSNLWIGTTKGLSMFDPVSREFSNHAYQEKDLSVLDITEDHENNLWLATENGGLILFNKSKKNFIPFPAEGSYQAILQRQVNALLKDKAGDILVGTQQDGLLIWSKERKTFSRYENGSNYHALTSNSISSIFQDHDNNIWIGTNGGGLNKFIKEKDQFYDYQRKVNEESSISSNNITCIYEDRTGVLWIGTELVGINNFDLLKQNFNHYQPGASSINSISGNIVWSIYEDPDKLLWIGTNEGLNTFDRERNMVRSYLPTIIVNGEKRNTSIYAIKRDSRGRLWLGTDGGLYTFNENTRSFAPSPASNYSRTYAIMEDSKGRIWAGTKEGIVLLSPNETLLARFTKNDKAGERELPNNVTRVIMEDEEGDIWVGTDDGLCRIRFNSSGKPDFKTYRREKNDPASLGNNTVLSLQKDERGFIWIGTFGGGLNRFDKTSESFIHYTQRDGLPNNVVYGILKDDKNNLWLSTNRGISNFNIASKSFRNFDESDGLQSNEFNVGAYHKSESGELFFGGIKGFNSFFPSGIRNNQRPPQLILTDFHLFNKPVEVGPNSILEKDISELDKIVLSHTDNVFSFSFAALHYSMPERNRYAYKMEGFDENWIYDDNSRRAKYTNLDPDHYVFKVKGTNRDGIWSEVVSIDVVITPPFWKIKWVWAVALFLVAGASFTYYRSRLKRIKAQKEFLELQVKERTKELIGKNEEVEKQRTLLEEEKDKLETLLLNILPQSTVEELKKKGKATARNYSKATVMFTDFKNFTKISEKLTPTELVERLDGFFVKFDEIIEKYNVEKIKTIGDAYMCAGGIPIRNKSNPVDVILAALEIQRTVAEIVKDIPKSEYPWGLRLGIHTGNLVAGVIGIKRFAYDIWGDTVNVASRVESGGEVGRVNISGDTYEYVKEFFSCEYRGKIHAKNKGEIDMFFVNSIRPELSKNGKGIVPNKLFWEYVNLHLFSQVDYRGAEKMMIEKLSKELSPDLYYHSVHHTIDVSNAAESLALQEGMQGEDIFVLKAAALFHDAGYIRKYRDNEQIGVELARELLPQYGFSEEMLNRIERLIYITFVENEPQSLIEKIIRDADLDYLGRDDFHLISDSLKKELIERKIITDDREWDEIQVAFISKHQYYTESARKQREAKKQQNLEEIRVRLQAYA